MNPKDAVHIEQLLATGKQENYSSASDEMMLCWQKKLKLLLPTNFPTAHLLDARNVTGDHTYDHCVTSNVSSISHCTKMAKLIRRYESIVSHMQHKSGIQTAVRCPYFILHSYLNMQTSAGLRNHEPAILHSSQTVQTRCTSLRNLLLCRHNPRISQHQNTVHIMMESCYLSIFVAVFRKVTMMRTSVWSFFIY